MYLNYKLTKALEKNEEKYEDNIKIGLHKILPEKYVKFEYDNA